MFKVQCLKVLSFQIDTFEMQSCVFVKCKSLFYAVWNSLLKEFKELLMLLFFFHSSMQQCKYETALLNEWLLIVCVCVCVCV